MANRTEHEISIMVLGSLHLANPGRDVFNVVVDDVSTERRQAEIASVVDGLASFEPTRIAVEAVDQTVVADQYGEYRHSHRQLERTEVEQIGFRLAAKLGLSGVDAVDVAYDFWVPEIERARADPRTARAWSELEQEGRSFVARCQHWLAQGTVGQVLWQLNSLEERDRAARLYSDVLLRMATPENDAGPRMSARWYARNVRILGRIFAVAAPGDRVLVLIGHAHAAIMRHLLETVSGVTPIDPLPFLPAPDDRLR